MNLTARLIAIASLLATTAHGARAIDTCTLPSVTSVAFGGYDPLVGSAVDSTGNITYHCTGTAATIAISINQGNAASFSPRAMQSGANVLSYNLYLDASRSSVWGDGTGATSLFQGTAVIGANTVLTIFGRIFGGQNAYVGSYTDTLVVTLSF